MLSNGVHMAFIYRVLCNKHQVFDRSDTKRSRQSSENRPDNVATQASAVEFDLWFQSVHVEFYFISLRTRNTWSFMFAANRMVVIA